MPLDTEVIRQHAKQVVREAEKNKQIPNALIRWTVPGLCDEIDRLKEKIAAVERLADDFEANDTGYGVPSPSWTYAAEALRDALED